VVFSSKEKEEKKKEGREGRREGESMYMFYIY
jgi:hypothetical protein